MSEGAPPISTVAGVGRNAADSALRTWANGADVTVIGLSPRTPGTFVARTLEQWFDTPIPKPCVIHDVIYFPAHRVAIIAERPFTPRGDGP